MGKTVTEGISLLPKIDGVWKWTAENTLQFQPKAEWPVGTQFKVSLNAKALTPKTLLDKWDIEFNAPLFIAGIVNSEFYQDPINAAMKKVVVNLNFSHPVDTAKLEKSIALKMRTSKTKMCIRDRIIVGISIAIHRVNIDLRNW